MFTLPEKAPGIPERERRDAIVHRAREAAFSGEGLGVFEPVRAAIDNLILIEAQNFSFKVRQKAEDAVFKGVIRHHPDVRREDRNWKGEIRDGAPAKLEVTVLAGAFIDGALEKAGSLKEQGVEAIQQFKGEVAERIRQERGR